MRKKNRDLDDNSCIQFAFYSIFTQFFFFNPIKIRYPVWINADIIPGPVDSEVIPVNPDEFLSKCKQLSNATLSIGWTTEWNSKSEIGEYTEKQIDEMIDAIERNQLNGTKHAITFPVRAGIAAQSQKALEKLINHTRDTNNATLTIWSSETDAVNATNLQNLILSFGVDRVYLDVPQKLASELNLSSTAASLIHFGIANLVILLVSFYMNYRRN